MCFDCFAEEQTMARRDVPTLSEIQKTLKIKETKASPLLAESKRQENRNISGTASHRNLICKANI
jgi:hypothetical protein